jgi:hypothetical protein
MRSVNGKVFLKKPDFLQLQIYERRSDPELQSKRNDLEDERG